MGNKTHPIGFRLGINKDWQAKWFASKEKEYRDLVIEDLVIRNTISRAYPDAGISRVDIERGSTDVVITIHTARPGIVIGRGGQKVEELRKTLEALTERRARLNVQEIRQPELDAFLVARSVADQLERRIAFRRAIRQAVSRSMQAGAQGIKILCSGRLGGADIARKEKAMQGRVPLHTLRADIDYSIAEAATDFGRIGVKVWIYRGDVLRKQRDQDEEDMLPIEVTLKADEDGAVGTAAEGIPPSTEVAETPEATVETGPESEVVVAPLETEAESEAKAAVTPGEPEAEEKPKARKKKSASTKKSQVPK